MNNNQNQNSNQTVPTNSSIEQPVTDNVVQNTVQTVENSNVQSVQPVQQAPVQNNPLQKDVSDGQTPPPVPQNQKNDFDNNKGPSTFAKIMTIFLFISLFLFVYFLNDITEYINKLKVDKQKEELISGRLVCVANKDSENLSSKIQATFVFENKGIVSLSYQTTTTGDKQKDKEELEKLYGNCKILREEVNNSNGIKVVCSQNSGEVVVKQEFDYKNMNAVDVRSAYSEAGGIYPEFKYKDNINRVENKMVTADFVCERSSS